MRATPTIYYHGTNEKFDNFDLDFAIEGGFFFSDDKKHAERFGKNIFEVSLPEDNLHLVNGVDVPAYHEMRDIEILIQAAKKENKDGVCIKNFYDMQHVQNTIIIFDPSHIKILQKY